ncbi:hypothetical protein DNTS_030064 [Danionella cerebrum]|uniref:Uncharacterized protein n=1 Tax=Danionella cerebrum TaxID=2873325 RepID=A0A553NJ73_9TELE|nr:hypothetical protein DNTS_030064 [Danionella translucida]
MNHISTPAPPAFHQRASAAKDTGANRIKPVFSLKKAQRTPRSRSSTVARFMTFWKVWVQYRSAAAGEAVCPPQGTTESGLLTPLLRTRKSVQESEEGARDQSLSGGVCLVQLGFSAAVLEELLGLKVLLKSFCSSRCQLQRSSKCLQHKQTLNSFQLAAASSSMNLSLSRASSCDSSLMKSNE